MAIESGEHADIIVDGGNPLTDAGSLRRVRLVMKDGRIVRREPLSAPQ
ncbi:hypothetical protein [Luteimonas salinilitoris]|uniref:Amidohydrolase-related domain-containing protein n=1 Tax=Luteimonas salinilitoris TaxID=3237697 RepID=A0ABV4HKW6_9GAMM